MNYEEIVDWTEQNFQLGDIRRSRALGEMAWGLMKCGTITFAAIGRSMEGQAEKASKITRVFNFCHNPHVDSVAVQQALLGQMVAKATFSVGGVLNLVALAIDWHSYDNGDMTGLRVSLMTGSRALPMLWYEFKTSGLTKGMRAVIEQEAIKDLIRLRPQGITWLLLLDAGFKSPELMPLLDEAGYYIVRSGSRVVVHGSQGCWTRVGRLPILPGQIVECGWLTWNQRNPFVARLVIARLKDIVPGQRGRRSSKHAKSKRAQPGLCAVLTNLPLEAFSSLAVIRLYARRFEIEHDFRDIKNATLGMDMEHVHLLEASTYSRLMCIVAVTEMVLWLAGSEAETQGWHLELTPSRPRDGRRVLSLRNVGSHCFSQVTRTLDELLERHLTRAIARVQFTVGRLWRDVKEQLSLGEIQPIQKNVRALPTCCARKATGRDRHPCTPDAITVAHPPCIPMAA